MAANHSRQQRHQARVAVDADGVVLALEDEFFLDQGAYVRTHGARVPEMTMAMLPGPYRIPAYRVTGHFRLTNKTPAATYRAPGRYEGSFVRERLIDAVADRLGLDRITVRRRNLIAADGDAVCPAAQRVGHRNRLRFRRLCAVARQGIGADRLGDIAGRAEENAAPRASWSGPGSASLSTRAGWVPSTAPGSASTPRARSSW